MTNEEKKYFTADLIFTDAIADYSLRTGESFESVRDQMIDSGAYDALYDFETGLWTQGPDYFIDFFLRIRAAKEKQEY